LTIRYEALIPPNPAVLKVRTSTPRIRRARLHAGILMGIGNNINLAWGFWKIILNIRP